MTIREKQLVQELKIIQRNISLMNAGYSDFIKDKIAEHVQRAQKIKEMLASRKHIRKEKKE